MSSLDSMTAIENRHDFDATFTTEFNNDTTNFTLVSPTSGKLLKITGIVISTVGAAAASGEINVKFVTSGNTVLTFHPGTSPANLELQPIVVRGVRNEALKVTSTLGAGKDWFIAVNYKEE